MATTKTTKDTGAAGFVYLPLLAGWLVPGAGHFLLGKWGRGALIAVSIVAMFVIGVLMNGKLYTETHDLLDVLSLVGDLGNGVLYLIGRSLGVGNRLIEMTTNDYGKVFIVGAGLLNVISAVDAHNLRTGRKSL